MGDVKIQVLKNGPLMVTGEIEILDSSGQSLKKTAQTALCRCGHSANKPFCDGTHHKVGFTHECARQTS